MKSPTAACAAIALILLCAGSASARSEGLYRNDGQLDAQVLFHGSSGNVCWFFEHDGITIVRRDRTGGGLSARIVFVDPVSAVAPRGAAELRGRGNFALGSDPARWRFAVPSYEEVVYEGAWPGVDLRFVLDGGVLSAAAEQAPGSDPSRIRFRVDGDEELASRLCHLPGDDGAADPPHHRPEVPAFVVWSTFLGGGLADYGNALAVRPSGNVLMAGLTTSFDYPSTPGAPDSAQSGGGDVCVSELDASGSTILWSTYLGGAATDLAQELVLDAGGDAILTGKTESADFPATSHCADETFNGASDVFVTKLDASGALRWSTFLGGAPYEIAFGLATDPDGNVAVAGYTQSADFPTTPGALDRSHNGGFDIFLTLVSAGGDRWLWSTFLGGSNDDRAYALARDPAGGYLLTAWTQSMDFPTTPGAYDETGNGNADVYVAKISGSGSTLAWSTLLGGNGLERAYGLAVDSGGNVLVAGLTHSPDFPVTAGAVDGTYNGAGDAFVARLSAAGDALQWCTFLGGSGEDVARDLVLAPGDRPVLAGSTQSAEFPTAGAGIDPDYNGAGDMFCGMLDASGRALLWGSYLGGAAMDNGNAVELAGGGEILMAGESESGDFPVTAGCADPTWNGQIDLVAARLRVEAAAEVPDPHGAAPEGTVLFDVAPNPNRGSAEATFKLDAAGTVRLTVHRADGSLLRTLLENGWMRAGLHRVRWDGADDGGHSAPAGMYRVRLQAGGRTLSRPAILIR